MSSDEIEFDYDYLTRRALRRVVHDVLTLTAELKKTPGQHHFYIEFATDAAGVAIPEELRAAYPERMTIVLQHQFENLDVGEEGFAVSLWFKGKQSRLSVPYEAVTSFADPSVQFGLRFDGEGAAAGKASAEPQLPPPAAAPAGQRKAADSADVVSLDQFRKK